MDNESSSLKDDWPQSSRGVVHRGRGGREGPCLNLIEKGLGSQVIVFRLLYCLSLPRTSEDRLTSLLS